MVQDMGSHEQGGSQETAQEGGVTFVTQQLEGSLRYILPLPCHSNQLCCPPITFALLREHGLLNRLYTAMNNRPYAAEMSRGNCMKPGVRLQTCGQ